MIIGFPSLEKCQTKDAILQIHGKTAADQIRAVLTGTPSDLTTTQRKIIAMLYLAGTILPAGSPCEQATATNFSDCEKSMSKNNPLTNPEIKAKYADLQKKIGLPPLNADSAPQQ